MKQLSPSILKTPVLLAISLSLGAMFWVASLPIALGANFTGTELIQEQLPHNMTLATAPKSNVLSAVCKAVKKHAGDSPSIARTAASARPELTKDILKTALRCLHEQQPDCELARSLLAEVIAADPAQAAALTEVFVAALPDCVTQEGGGNGAGGNLSSAPGSLGGGGSGGAASGNVCQVCQNNQTIELNCDDLNAFLKNHPGATPGPCQATTITNR